MTQLVSPGNLMGARRGGGAAAPFTPLDVALGWWDVDRSDLITETAGLLSSFKDSVAGYDATAVLLERPTYSATGWKGVSPGITFNGIANLLTLASQPFPSGDATSSIFAVVDQTALAADATTRCIASYGGTTATTQRRLLRAVVTGANVARAGTNTGTANAAGDFSGRHYVRNVSFVTGCQAAFDGVQSATANTTPGTGATRFRIGATANDVPANFFQGVLKHLIITGTLTAGELADLNTWMAGQL